MKSYLTLTNQGPHNWDPIPCTYCSVITSCKFDPCLHSCPRTPETLGIFCIFKIMRWVKDGTWDSVWIGLDFRTFHQVIRGLGTINPSPSGDKRVLILSLVTNSWRFNQISYLQPSIKTHADWVQRASEDVIASRICKGESPERAWRLGSLTSPFPPCFSILLSLSFMLYTNWRQ